MNVIYILIGMGLIGAAIYFALAKLFSARSADAGELRAVREERDRAASALEGARREINEHAMQVARLSEQLKRFDALEKERMAALERMAEAESASKAAEKLLSEREVQLRELTESRLRAERELETARKEREQLAIEKSKAAANLEHNERANKDMREFLDSAQAKLSLAFAEMAGKAFDATTKTVTAQSKLDFESLLKPFAERVQEFRTRLDHLYGEESRERASLLGAVNELKTLNQEMAGRTTDLTRALKGNAKVRGDWGEMMLESVLSGSGLEEGRHYDRQKRSMDDEGRWLQPDIVIRLPDERKIVIDSKVNLIAWQEAMNAGTPEEQQEAMRRHAVALKQHVKDLGEKNYPKLLGDAALEITVAFVPIEGALSAALGFDDSLQSFAFEKKVVFASPNTLMAVLRVVDRLWARDKVQKQAIEISAAGGKVLDALTGFLSDFDMVGKRLNDAASAFSSARNRLSESNQAVIPRARKLAELGARSKRALHQDLEPDPADILQLSKEDKDI